MAHTYEELKSKTLAELREIAAGVQHEAVQGYTQLNKDHLLEALCKALNVDMHAHKQVVGVDKTAIKGRIKGLKQEREAAIAAHDQARLKSVRREIHHWKRELHKAMV